jgi:hypothetical protein
MEEAPGRPNRWLSAAIFAVAFTLCMAVTVLFPGIHYPDEVIQSLEQAHRVVFGYGLVPWEFRDGARSWLLPGLLMPPMWLGDALAPGTEAYRYFAQAAVAALSASTAVVGYWWGQRLGRWHGVLAALVLGTWFEAVYFGARALGEVVASAFLFAGVFLCSGRRDARRAILAGLCLGGAFVFRFHLAPAIALAAAWHCRLAFRRGWLPLLAGASQPLLLLGVIDALAWGTPFGSILANFQANIVEGRSLLYGTSPVDWYVLLFLERWSAAVGAIAVLSAWGARRDPLPLLVALVVVLTHSAIAHKEYRFIYPAIPLVLFSAALGSAEFCRWLAARLNRPALHAGFVAVAAVAWLVTSYALASAPHMRPEWFRGRAGLELMSRARSEADCGVGLLVGWSWTGGYSSLHEDIPIHLLGWDRRTWRVQAFDAWILPRGSNQPAALGYRLVQCEVQGAAGLDELCLWVREGGCDQRGASTEAQQVLETTGQ